MSASLLAGRSNAHGPGLDVVGATNDCEKHDRKATIVHASRLPAASPSESSRLELLHLLEILDTASEPAFEALAQSAAALCGCPISLVSLIDVDRQWFKARTGLGATETPRDQAFCAHAIQGEGLFEVNDALRDERFADNPLVTGDPRIRFYAGQPIVYEGVALGTLCVIDRVPRELGPLQRVALKNLSVVLTDLLRGRMQAILHRRESKRLYDFAHLSGDWLWESDALHRVTWFEGDPAPLTGLFASGLPTQQFRDLDVLDATGRACDGGIRLLELLSRCEGFEHTIVEIPAAIGTRYLSLSARPIAGARGEHEGLRGSVQDVTDKIRAELLSRRREQEFAQAHRELQASERRIRAVTDNVPALIAHVDRDERYTFANSAVSTVFGFEPQTIIGRTMRELREPAQYEQVKPYVDRALAGERTSFDSTSTIDGRTYHYQSVFVPDVDPDGSVIGFFLFTSDLTKRRVAELRQAESEKLLRGIADHLPALVCYVDIDDKFRFANETYASWLGLDPNEMVGRDYRQILDADTSSTLQPYVARARAGETVTFERRICNDQGVRHLVTEYVPDVGPDGVVLGVYAMSTDITEQRRTAMRLAEGEQRLREITDSLPALVCEFDLEERCVFANDYALNMFGVSREHLAGVTFRSPLPEALYAMHQPAIAAALKGERPIVRGQRPGSDRYFEAHYSPAFDADGRQRGFYLMSLDVTLLKRAELDRRHSETRLLQITDALPVLVSYVDAAETMTYVNETFCSWIGKSKDHFIGRTVRESCGDELYEQRRDQLRRCLAGEIVNFEIKSVVRGQMRSMRTTYLPDRRSDGRIVGLTTMSVDVTEHKLAEERLSQLAHFDALTGLPNRRQFNNVLAELLAAPGAEPARIAVMFLDVDHFKQINDQYGHAVGDGVLTAFARRVRQSVRTTDFVARLAGDEFVVILRDLSDRREAEALARKIVRRTGRAMTVSDRSISVTTSVGISLCDASTSTPATLLARADEALYRAKEAGRNTFRLAG